MDKAKLIRFGLAAVAAVIGVAASQGLIPAAWVDTATHLAALIGGLSLPTPGQGASK